MSGGSDRMAFDEPHRHDNVVCVLPGTLAEELNEYPRGLHPHGLGGCGQ